MPRCDYCKAPADWKRPPGPILKTEGFRCDAHTPEWRVREYEALTLTATRRKEAADKEDMPKPNGKKKGGK